MKKDPDYTVVSDFSTNGATRGMIFPVLDRAGDVVRPRKPDDPLPDLTEPDRSSTRHKRYPRREKPIGDRVCISCGEDISSRFPSSKRCVLCADEQIVETARQWNTANPERRRANRRRWREGNIARGKHRDGVTHD